MDTNPFDRTNLGYDGLFGPRTMFYHLQPLSNRSLVESINVPVLEADQVRHLIFTTNAAILVGAIWICWVLLMSVLNKRTKKSHPGHAKKRS